MATKPAQLVTKSSHYARITNNPRCRLSYQHLHSTISVSQSTSFRRSSHPTGSRTSLLGSQHRDYSSKVLPWKVTRPISGALHQPKILRYVSNEAQKPISKPVEPFIPVKDSNSTTQPPSILTQLNPLSPTKPKESREYIWTLPNILTFSRLGLTPVIGYTILTSQPYIALGLFAYAGITDLIDGWVARHYNQQTVLGTVIDPMADKALMTTVVICTTLQGLLPTWLAVIILGRDVALAISAIYFRYISLPPPKTFGRFWDFSLPSAEVHPTEISKINTLLQLLLIGNAMVLPALPETVVGAWNLMGVFEGWQYLVATTTVWSGLSYIWSKDAVKILSVEEAKAKEVAMKEGKK